jgi:hypothetical protein
MTNSFLNRVSAERRVLAVVNAKLPKECRLTGLSSAAISQWREKAGSERASSITPTLISLAEKCQTLSDRSQETFKPLDKTHSELIEKELLKVKEWSLTN